MLRTRATRPGPGSFRLLGWLGRLGLAGVEPMAQLREWRWLGPAELREDNRWRLHRDDGARHLPDLGLVQDGQRVAVEVELHAKAPQRMRVILRGYRALIDRGAITAVTYVTDRSDVAALIHREADAAMLGDRLHIGPLATVIAKTRERGERR